MSVEESSFEELYSEHYRERLGAKGLIERSGWGVDNEVGVFHLVVQIARLLALRPENRLLDAGCGVGIFSILLSPMVSEVVAGDYLPDVCDAARTNTKDIDNIHIAEIDLMRADTLPTGCHKVLVNSVLQGLGGDENIARALDSLARVIPSEGLCLLTCNADRSCKQEFIAGIDRLDFDEPRKQRMRAIHGAAPWVDRDVLREAAECAGFSIVSFSRPPQSLWQSWYMFNLLLRRH